MGRWQNERNIMALRETPFKLGYSMPAEWEEHEATWLSWPKDPTTFPAETIGKVESIYIEMIDALSEGERVNVLVNDAETEKKIASMIRSDRNVSFPKIKSVDVWIRDYGPIFVKNKRSGRAAATKWQFNAWGNKYEDLLADNEAGLEVAKLTKSRIFEPKIVLEGGSIDFNGMGTLLTTKQCLLNRNRNPSLSAGELEIYLNEYLGATNVIWLEEGIAGDDTDGHVDDIARFVSSDTIICMVEDDSSDPDHNALRRNFELLHKAHDQSGEELNVLPVPMPKRKLKFQGYRLPASYANFYIANSAVLIPTYGDPNDDVALDSIGKYFPTRKKLGIECSSLVFGFGSIHCVTQQQPQ
jgi:agmatine deiminase